MINLCAFPGKALSTQRLILQWNVAAIALFWIAAASSENFPNAKPIRILTSESGSGSDIVARLIAERLPATLGQRGIVDNRGIVAVEIAAKAPPDGYTVLFYSTPLWISPLIRRNVPWDTMRDFLPVTMAANTPNVLVVPATLQINSVKELIAAAKARPGELNYGSGSSGSSSHLAAELFKAMAGVDIVRIPYKGVGPALIGLMSNQVHLIFASASSGIPHVRSGRLKALAVASARPSALLPGLPTVAASGVPGYVADTPLGVLVPAGTPAEIVDRLHEAIVGALFVPEVKRLIFDAGEEVVGSSPAEFSVALKAEIARWGDLIRERGIREE
jgi:tripartite-type tricarboxylate transporter receptor subunit TctC